jgi:phage shock protein PspC (stress-responsive transcriptional regulator)
MQKVVTINLNGNAYQTDEAGYTALIAYLEGAERSLKDNPDRAEILADLEQAIADKCRGFLGPHKTVVTATEVEQIIREMGPVEGSGAADAPGDGSAQKASAGPDARSGAPRRLYLIHEGAMLAGVCNGLAAYLHVDVTIVRIVFLFLALVTRGGFGLVYLVLAFVIPPADTSEQRAAAHGQPFNARELIDRAKSQYAGFAAGKDWRRRWRREQRAWRQRWRASRWQPQAAWSAAPPAPGDYGTRIVSGAMVPILSIISVLFFWFWAWAVYSLVTTGQVLGQALPGDIPFWVGILVLVCVYHAVAWPLHFARRRAAYYSLGQYGGFIPAWDGALSLTFGILAVWMAYHYIPEVREVIKTLPDVWKSFSWNDLSR